MHVLEEPRIQRHRWTVEQYHRMAEAGLFPPDSRVELIHGEVIEMAPMGSRHYAVVMRLNSLLSAAVGQRASVGCQGRLRLGPASEPEPDLCVLKLKDDFYASALPTAADAWLVIEVADTTLAYDLRVKLPLYAQHGVPTCWVVDLQTPLLRVFADPHDGQYRHVQELASPGRLAVPGLDGVELDLHGILLMPPS